jgi:predicted transcriptional regulator
MSTMTKKRKAPAARRPPRMSVSVSISPEMVARLDEVADELDLSRSVIIQIALREYFARRDS